MTKKKVLIITYYWPPAGGPGVQRWLKFVKYLPEFNIEPIVYCPSNPSYPLLDDSLLKEASNYSARVIKQPINEPYKLAKLFSKQTKTISKGIISEEKKQGLAEKLMLFVRGNFFIPDARKNWIQPSVSYLSQFIVKENIDTIITTGPPHSMHLIGLQLKKELNVKWIADFRDPWTTIGYHKQLRLLKKAENKHKFLEKTVLNTADKLIVTSWETKKEFQQITKQSITVITNGYDEEEVDNVTLDSQFSIAHIGSLLSERNPEILWTVLSDLVKENSEFAKKLQLNFVGFISENVLESITNNKLSNYINNIGYISHKAAIEYQKKSQILLLVEIDSQDTKAIIPGKLFEYMVSKRPILAIGPEGSDVARILKETNTGNYFNYKDYNVLKTQLLKHFMAYQSNSLKVISSDLENYNRKSLTKALTALINTL